MPKLQTQFFVQLLFLNNVQISTAALPVNPAESYWVPSVCGVRKEEKPSCQGLKQGKLFILISEFPSTCQRGRSAFSLQQKHLCSRYSTFLNVQFSNFLMFLCQKNWIPNSEGNCAAVCKLLRGSAQSDFDIKINGIQAGWGSEMLGFFLYSFSLQFFLFLAESPSAFKYMWI